MTPTPHTIVTPDKDAVTSEVVISAPPERIFQALTSVDQLMRWWNGEGKPCRVTEWNLEPRLGGRFRYTVEDPTGKTLSGGSAVFSGQIVEFDPPRALAYTWSATLQSAPHQSHVRWELIPTDKGTLVKMTHSGLGALPEAEGATAYAQGWPGIIASLKAFAESIYGPTKTVTTIVTPDLDSLISEIDIAAPPERVFSALTDASQLKRWFGDASCPLKSWQMDARLGGRYSYSTEKADFQINGVDHFECHGEIIKIDPPRLLVYTWIGNWHANRDLKTTVRWELAPTGQGTHLTVTHSGLAQEKVAREDYQGGWPGVVQNLKNFVEQQQ